MDRAHCYEPWSSGGSIPLRHITHPLSDDSPKQRDLSGYANFLRQHRPYGRFIFYLPHPNPPFQTLYLPHTAILSYQWTNKKHRQIHCFIGCLRQPNHYHNKSTTKKHHNKPPHLRCRCDLAFNTTNFRQQNGESL